MNNCFIYMVTRRTDRVLALAISAAKVKIQTERPEGFIKVSVDSAKIDVLHDAVLR
jgi:hypothetical protein